MSDYDYILFDPDGDKVDVRDLFVEWLDCEPWPTVLGIEFSPDDVLLTLDPVAYNVALREFYDELLYSGDYTIESPEDYEDEDDDKDDEVTE